MQPRGLDGGASRLATAKYNTLIRESGKFEPVEGKERARMYIDHATADLRTDAAWLDLYSWSGSAAGDVSARSSSCRNRGAT